VWAVLTDYEHLADFVPNLESCERLPGGRPTRYRLRQRGCSQSLYWRLEAGAVLDVQARAVPRRPALPPAGAVVCAVRAGGVSCRSCAGRACSERQWYCRGSAYDIAGCLWMPLRAVWLLRREMHMGCARGLHGDCTAVVLHPRPRWWVHADVHATCTQASVLERGWACSTGALAPGCAPELGRRARRQVSSCGLPMPAARPRYGGTGQGGCGVRAGMAAGPARILIVPLI